MISLARASCHTFRRATLRFLFPICVIEVSLCEERRDLMLDMVYENCL